MSRPSAQQAQGSEPCTYVPGLLRCVDAPSYPYPICSAGTRDRISAATQQAKAMQQSFPRHGSTGLTAAAMQNSTKAKISSTNEIINSTFTLHLQRRVSISGQSLAAWRHACASGFARFQAFACDRGSCFPTVRSAARIRHAAECSPPLW